MEPHKLTFSLCEQRFPRYLYRPIFKFVIGREMNEWKTSRSCICTFNYSLSAPRCKFIFFRSTDKHFKETGRLNSFTLQWKAVIETIPEVASVLSFFSLRAAHFEINVDDDFQNFYYWAWNWVLHKSSRSCAYMYAIVLLQRIVIGCHCTEKGYQDGLIFSLIMLNR